jgi:hypothetical protein
MRGAFGIESYGSDRHGGELFRAFAKGHRRTRDDGSDRLGAACRVYSGIFMGFRRGHRRVRGEGV